MLRSDLGKDGRRLAGYVRMSLADVARKMGVKPQMVQKYLSGGITQRYIDFVEACGYDIELKYVKRDDFERWPVGYSEMICSKRKSEKLKSYYAEQDAIPLDPFTGWDGE